MIRSYRFLIAIFFIAFSFIRTGCNDYGVDPQAVPQYLVGQVQDENGNTLPDVGVHYLFEMNPLRGLQTPDNILPAITIRYVVLDPAHVSLKVLRWYTEELIRTLVDTQQNPGTYAVTFDAGQMTNGVYLYRLSVGTSVTERRIVLLNTDITELIHTSPLATSNAQGKFTIANAQFGLSLPFVRTSSSGTVLDTAYISPTIQMVLHKDGYQTLVQPILIDPSKETRASFVLRR
jgi:predicted transcriptional regulator